MLSEKHDVFRNKWKLQDSIRSGKEKALPAGLNWGGKLLILRFYNHICLSFHYRCCSAIRTGPQKSQAGRSVYLAPSYGRRYQTCGHGESYIRKNKEWKYWEIVENFSEFPRITLFLALPIFHAVLGNYKKSTVYFGWISREFLCNSCLFL